MFFVGIMGVDSRDNMIRELPEEKCQECGKTGGCTLYQLYSSFSLFFIPVFNWGSRYVVRCSHCDSVYSVAEEDYER